MIWSRRYSSPPSVPSGSARSWLSGCSARATSAGCTSAGTSNWTGWSPIKVPRADRFDGPQDIDRFLHEARLAARVKHPGIVTVHQVDRDKHFGCFVVLEYIEGRPLSSLLQAERLAPERAAQLLVLAADALSFAHEQGLVHRDLKPDNILMDTRERPHIADFGLALLDDDRWPRRGEVAGTPHYMAPEQVRGESHRLDGRTDLWALGVILYRMLTEHRPFDGELDGRSV